MKKTLPLLLIWLLNSCASIMNEASTDLTIITNTPAKLVLDKDTINSAVIKNNLTVLRSKKPLQVTVFNDSISKTIQIASQNSFGYYANIFTNYGIGMLIDKKKMKRYTYPSFIYIDLNKKDNLYKSYIPFKDPFHQKNIIKITPFKLVGFYNSSVEISYEHATGNIFSTQLMASYLLPQNIMIEENTNISHDYKGYRFALEEKYYLKEDAPQGSYLALELDYLKNEYYDYWGFGDELHPETIYSETFGINKKTYSINIKFGHQYLTDKLSVDWYIGIGARYKDVQHFERTNYNDKMTSPRFLSIYYIANKPGKYWTISMPMNVRIGWRF